MQPQQAAAMGQVPLSLHELLHASSSPQTAVVSGVLLLIFPLLAVFLLVRRRATREEALLRKLPSLPGRLPILGHLHLVGPLPHVSLRDLAAKHGRDGLLLLRLGAVPTLVASSARAARAVLRTQDHVFASRAYQPVTDILFYGSSDVAFAPYGDHWRQVKKIATTHLLTNKKVRSYRHAREREVSSVVARIRRAAAEAGAAVDLSDLLNAFTNDVVCHAVSGKFFREEGRNKLFRELVETNSSLIGGFNLEDHFPVLVKLDIVKRMVCARAEKVHRAWDELLEKLIDDHASRLVTSERDGDDDESDFIDVLLSVQQEYKLTRGHIKAQLAIMFEAGTDTSFIVLEYAMAQLMRHPHVAAKLRAEVRSTVNDLAAAGKQDDKDLVTEDDLAAGRFPYLRAVIKETLRLHAPAPLLVPHLSTADCDVEGYTIPAGTRAIVNIWALARDPDHWESPDDFMPERFLAGEEVGSAAAMDYKGNDFPYLPFGAGRRICPGINFAIATIEVMLANLVYHFDWELPPGVGAIDMTESFGVTVHRTEKLLLVPKVPNKLLN